MIGAGSVVTKNVEPNSMVYGLYAKEIKKLNNVKKIKVGVVGIGYMGVNHLRVYAKIPNIELVGFFDSRNFDIKKDFDIKSFSSLDEMSKKVDAVSIATPAKTHYRICSFFLKKKIHCLVEKPIATSEKDCKELISLAKKNKLVLLVGHIERFNPVITKLKSIIDKFKVRIINIERLSFVNTRNQDIDTVQDLMIHDIDLLNFLIKSKIHRIETMGFISKKNCSGICMCSYQI